MERQHLEASIVQICSTHGTPEGYHMPSMLWPDDDGMVCRQEPSLAHSYYVGNHNAHSAQGTRWPRPDIAGEDLLHYEYSDLDNHG